MRNSISERLDICDSITFNNAVAWCRLCVKFTWMHIKNAGYVLYSKACGCIHRHYKDSIYIRLVYLKTYRRRYKAADEDAEQQVKTQSSRLRKSSSWRNLSSEEATWGVQVARQLAARVYPFHCARAHPRAWARFSGSPPLSIPPHYLDHIGHLREQLRCNQHFFSSLIAPFT